ncbi:hypothetical protein JST99_00730 [Candidatus Dependentiae bacterium]|nr:hypothetical protein [Candidatus Dependentiae bacterium]
MKSINKLICACTLLLAGSAYTAQTPMVAHEKPVVTQTISIYNDTGLNIYASIYLTNLIGTKSIRSTYPRQIEADGKCLTFTIKKPANKKRTEFHRIVVSENANDMLGSKADSTMIEWFSGNKPLTYKITANKGKLKVSRDKKVRCNTPPEEIIELFY